jgi:hypothetical protein
MEVIITMNLQDIFAYCIAGAMLICFAYFAWASRKGQNSNKGPKEK